MIGAIGAALTLGLRGGGVLVSLLVLPLCIPVLIFGTSAVEAVNTGVTIIPNVSLLAAMFLFAFVFTPWVTAQALRISME
jgi:heme exporter protein B